MVRLNYLNDEERNQQFRAAKTVWATRRGRTLFVYGPLEKVTPTNPTFGSAYPEMFVPIDNRSELRALLDDCSEIKGTFGVNHEALADYDQVWPDEGGQ